jgi:hypothetical protein
MEERGISLIITFWIMTISLAVFLGVVVILISEIKIVGNLGNAVSAFYSADSGVEKTLYFDRKEVPENSKRGLCNICNVCPDNNNGCKNCALSGQDCSLETCKDCQVSYNTYLEDMSYEIRAKVMPADANFSNFNIYSKGIFKDAIRAINLQILKKESGPSIINTLVILRPAKEGVKLDIAVDVIDPDGVDAESVIAHIQSPDGNDIATINLDPSGQRTYRGSWVGPQGIYYVDISACDLLGNCAVKNNI